MAGSLFTFTVTMIDDDGKPISPAKAHEYFSKTYLQKNKKLLGAIENGSEFIFNINSSINTQVEPGAPEYNQLVQKLISTASGDIFEYLLGEYLTKSIKITSSQSEEKESKPDAFSQEEIGNIKNKINNLRTIRFSIKDGDGTPHIYLITISDSVISVIERAAKNAAEAYAEAHPYNILYDPTGQGGNPLGDFKATGQDGVSVYIEAKWSKSPQSSGAGSHWWRPSIYNFADEDQIKKFLARRGSWYDGKIDLKKEAPDIWVTNVRKILVDLNSDGGFLPSRIKLSYRNPKNWMQFFISKGTAGVKNLSQNQKIDLGKDVIIGTPPVSVNGDGIKCFLDFNSQTLTEKIQSSKIEMALKGGKTPYTAFTSFDGSKKMQAARFQIEKDNLKKLADYGAGKTDKKEKLSVTYDFYILNKFINSL